MAVQLPVKAVDLSGDSPHDFRSRPGQPRLPCQMRGRRILFGKEFMALVMDRLDPARIVAIQGAGETDECLEIQACEDGSRNDG
ncbi:hypothetical protein D3C76_508370 [compost metagenome]